MTGAESSPLGTVLLATTFSIAARCERTGLLGAAVSTAVPAVGALCTFVRAGAGAICTQSRVNPYLGIDGLTLLAAGWTAPEALEAVLRRDPLREVRQLGVVDAQGHGAVHTGSDCPAWAGHRAGSGYTVQGNTLTGEGTIAAMAHAFEADPGADLPERLLRALEAGQAAGGDRRGRQSAALYVVGREEYPYLSLRVDAHAEPVAELRRILEIARAQLLPLVETLPTRADPAGRIDPQVTAMLARPPADRGLPGPGPAQVDAS